VLAGAVLGGSRETRGDPDVGDTTATATPPPAVPDPADAMIRLEGATKIFPGSEAPAVDSLTMAIPEGELVVFVGPSGCGKTTTLKMINRIIEPTSGTITVGGQDVFDRPAHLVRRDIGYVIQQIGLFPHHTIERNIATVPRLLGWEDDRTAARVDELIELMDLDPAMKSRYPAELSGGQRQRVGVARALAADPPVLLMDEPYGAVDPLVRGRLQDQLLDLQQELGKTIVFVTHDIDEAIKLGDRIAILNTGGKVEQFDTPEALLRDPANEFVEEFLGGERGLKRLALRQVQDLGDPKPGAVVPADATGDDAVDAAESYGVDWCGILDGDDLRGWAWVDDLREVARAGDAETRRFRVAITPTSTLREALDTMVRSRTGVSVVFDDDDRFLGMLQLADLTAEITGEPAA
jgi:osmoprotectant transport system ATP-binding protein